jgi:hypothetical protein
MRTIVTKVISAIASISLFALATGSAQAAGTASLSINGGTYQQGKTYLATVRENSTDPVVSVEANLTYDTSKLECLGVDGSASPFTIQYQGSCSGGTISIARATAGTTVTGSQVVAIVTFRALATSGSTSLNFTAGSGIYRSPDAVNVWNGALGGTSISFVGAPTPTAAPTAVPTSAPTAAPTAQPTVMAQTTTPTPTPSPSVIVSPTPMEGNPTVEPSVVPAPVSSDNTRSVSASTVGSIIAVLAAGATAIFVIRRMRANS